MDLMYEAIEAREGRGVDNILEAIASAEGAIIQTLYELGVRINLPEGIDDMEVVEVDDSAERVMGAPWLNKD